MNAVSRSAMGDASNAFKAVQREVLHMLDLKKVTDKLNLENRLKEARIKREKQQEEQKDKAARQDVVADQEEDMQVEPADEPVGSSSDPLSSEEIFQPQQAMDVLDLQCIDLPEGFEETDRQVVLHNLISTGLMFSYQAPSPPLLQLLFKMSYLHKDSHAAHLLLLRHYAEQGKGACWFPQLQDFYDALVTLGYTSHVVDSGSGGGGSSSRRAAGAPAQQSDSEPNVTATTQRILNLQQLLRLMAGAMALFDSGMYDSEFYGVQQDTKQSRPTHSRLVIALLRMPLDPRVSSRLLPDISCALNALLSVKGWDEGVWTRILDECSTAVALQAPSHRASVAMLKQLTGSRGVRVQELLQHGAVKLLKHLLGAEQEPSKGGSRHKKLDVKSVKDLFSKRQDTFLAGPTRDFHKILSLFESMHLLFWSLTFCSSIVGGDERAAHASWLIGTFVKRVGRAVEYHNPVCITIKGMVPALQSLYIDLTEPQS